MPKSKPDEMPKSKPDDQISVKRNKGELTLIDLSGFPQKESIHIITSSKTATEPKRRHDLGEPVPNRGVYLGFLKPEALVYNGNVIILPYAHLYSTEKPLTDYADGLFTFTDTIEEISKLKNIDGHNGIFLPDRPENAKDKSYKVFLYEHWAKVAAGDKNLKNGWILGPMHMVDAKNKVFQALNEQARLSKNFKEESVGGGWPGNTRETDANEYPHHEWTCTELPGQFVINLRTSNGDIDHDRKNGPKLAARPLRLDFE